MVNVIRPSNSPGLNKGRGSKFCVGSRVRQETLEEGRRTYQPKRCEYNDKDEDNSPKTWHDKNSVLVILYLSKFSPLGIEYASSPVVFI